MLIQDPRKLVTEELPSYPGSSVKLYNDLTTGQRIEMQSRYNHVIQAMVSVNQGMDNMEMMKGIMGSESGVKLSDIQEMNLYMILLAIKSWNLEENDEQGNIVPVAVTIENMKRLLFDKDVEVLRNIVSPQQDEKKNGDK